LTGDRRLGRAPSPVAQDEAGDGEWALSGERKAMSPNRPACRVISNARSLKTIFSASRIGTPLDRRFAGAQIRVPPFGEEDSTHSDFLKDLAGCMREEAGFLRFSPREPKGLGRRRRRGDGLGAHLLTKAGKYS
jgi:hypothetical protein